MKCKSGQPVPAVMAIFLFLFLACCGFSVIADEELLPPQQVIQSTADKLQATLHEKAMKKDFVRATDFVRGVITPHVDFDLVSKRVLGKHWKNANAEQKEKFRSEFRDLLVRTYTRAFIEYSDWEIKYLPLRMKPEDKTVVVKTEILQPGAPSVGVDYRMRLKDGTWKVYDVIIEGIGLVQNYRTSFKNEIARSGSLNSVIAQLTERNDEALSTK